MEQNSTARSAEPRKQPQLVLLDVYDTLLRMDEVERKVNNLLHSKHGYTLWFELFMQYCFVDNAIARFNDFRSIAHATMQMASNMLEREVADDDIGSILEMLKHLPVHEGVQRGLSALNDMGLRIAALTNSPEATVCERMEMTGLISYFEQVLSAERVGKYKPSLAVYEWATKKLGVDPGEVLLVSTHGWDLAGGQNAGMQTAHIRQPRQMLYPLAPAPDYYCDNLPDLARQLSRS